MTRFKRIFLSLILFGGLFILLRSLFIVPPALADKPAQQTEQYCLSCHGNPDLSMTLPSGENLSLYISAEVLSGSVHSPMGIECEACHTNIKTYPHPQQAYTSRRDLTREVGS